MSDYDHLVYEQGPVTVITINRPERMNAIGPQTHRELIDAWDRFRSDDDALVGVLTGAGDRAFCAGGDLKAAFAGELVDVSPAEIAGVLGPSRWTDIYKPTIAAINGVAYAGGLEWACWADLAIADEHATFGVTCRRWNIGLADGGTQRLTRILGYRRAIDLIITGRVIDAHEAERIGLVNEVVPKGTCLQRALELANTIATLPQPALRSDLQAARSGQGRPLEEGLRIEAQCFNRSIFASETYEGLRQFNERDHPDRRDGTAPVTPGLTRSSCFRDWQTQTSTWPTARRLAVRRGELAQRQLGALWITDQCGPRPVGVL
jgi:enoyl-CoA hydratase